MPPIIIPDMDCDPPFIANAVSTDSSGLLKFDLDNAQEQAKYDANKDNSPLLRLPGEIRNRIYEHAIGHRNIGIDCYFKLDPERKAFGRISCDPERERIIAGQVHPEKSKYYHRQYPPHPQFKPTIINLSKVCRQLYQETAVLPYKLNKFKFWDITFIMKQWAAARLPAQLALIAKVEPPEQWMKEAYLAKVSEIEVLKNVFPGLKKLYVVQDAFWKEKVNRERLEAIVKTREGDVEVIWV